MPIAVDNAGQSNGGSVTTSVSIASFAVGNGLLKLLFVGVSYFTGTTNPTAVVQGITFNGGALSFLDLQSASAFGAFQKSEIWYMKAPPNVTGSIVVTMTATTDELVVGADSWTGVDQVNTFGTVAKNNAPGGGSGVASVTVSSNTNAIVHDVDVLGDTTVTWTPSNTQHWQQNNAANQTRGVGQAAPGATSVVLTWTIANTLSWASMGVGINADTSVITTVYPGDMTPGCNVVFNLV